MEKTTLKSHMKIKKMLMVYLMMFIVLVIIEQGIMFWLTRDEELTLIENIIRGADNNMIYTSIVFVSIAVIAMVIITVYGLKMVEEVRKNNEKLVEYAEHAEEANAAKTIFLANMSHEIRTPLNAIIGFSNILSISELPAAEKEYSGIVARSATSLLTVINDILDISKIESDVFDIHEEVFEVEPFLEQLVELYSVKADEKKIQLSCFFDGSIPPFVHGDSYRLQQVISNLLSNAIKFTPQKGQVIFKALLLSRNDDKATIRFTVKDTGIGISEEGQKKIFEPFTQADGSITRKFGGTGLGLSISRKIVDAMNSELELSSEMNKGSLFSFEVEFRIDETFTRAKYPYRDIVFGLFPLIPNDPGMRDRLVDVLSNYGKVIMDASERYYSEVDYLIALEVDNIYLEARNARRMYKDVPIIYASREMNMTADEGVDFYEIVREPFYKSKFEKIITNLTAKQTGEKESDSEAICFEGTVLVAEDNSTNQIFMRVLLEQLGVNIIFADNGLDAIERYKDNEVDIILMDIHMPVLDGLRAMEDIRKLEERMTVGPNAKRKVPIVALTADAFKGDREKYLNLGMDDYLSKPLNYNRLVAVFYKYLNVAKYKKKGQVVGDSDVKPENYLGVLEIENVKAEDIPEQGNAEISGETHDAPEPQGESSVAKVINQYIGDESLSFKERVRLANLAEQGINRAIPVIHIKKTEKQENPQSNNVNGLARMDVYQSTDDCIRILHHDYDKEAACKFIGVDDITLDMLIDNFKLTFKKDLDTLRNAIRSGDTVEIHKAAHYIKGSAANLRMDAMEAALETLCDEAKNGQVSKVDFDSLDAYVQAVVSG